VAENRPPFYELTVPVFIHTLGALRAVLRKGADDADRRGIDPRVFLEGRLAPDMFPLVRQVQIATDQAKGGAARLAGEEPPRFEDTEASFPELEDRIERTIAFLETLDAAAFAAAPARTIRLPQRERTVELPALPYLQGYVFPNFFFHATTAYAILRHLGVTIGKMDFLGVARTEDLARGLPLPRR
jgi:hypothetical protein